MLTLASGAVEAPAQAPSAGGAPLDEVIVVAVFTALVYAAILWVMYRERTGRRTLVGQAADAVARLDGGSPRWFALPLVVAVGGALSGAVGLYWDVSYHIAEGRDEGPLANPAHYFIFVGLIAVFAGGALGLALADDRLPRRTFRVTRRWRTPIGPTVATGIALCALLGFPLDDVWHRLFGQDVTEWGPTHVLMIGGTLMLPYTMLLTAAEARQLGPSRLRSGLEWVAILVIATGPVAFLLEFAYGVPQFPLLNDPVILAVATVATFLLAMLRGLRWVVTVWLAHAGLQGLLVGLNVVAFDALTPWPPLLLGGAVVAALLARTARPTVGYGALAGLAITLGMLVVEYFWSHATRPMPWPAEMMPWAVLFAGLAGAGTGVVATWLHQQLVTVGARDAVPSEAAPATAPATGPATAPATAPATVPATAPATGPARTGWAALAAALVVLGVFVVNVPPEHDREGSVEVTVGAVSDGRAPLQVTVDPALVQDAYWFEVLSWQGGGSVHAQLEATGPGQYRTDRPVPVDGSWKTMVRLHTPLHSLAAAPVYLPADPAIPAEEVPAVSGPRDLVEERHILRREEKQDVPGWLWGTGYVVVGGLFLLLFTLVAAGYTVAARPGRETATPTRRTRGLVGARG